MKRAAIIVTDADRITGLGYEGESWLVVEWFSKYTSEQLLADLRYLVNAVRGPESARVRAAIGDTDA